MLCWPTKFQKIILLTFSIESWTTFIRNCFHDKNMFWMGLNSKNDLERGVKMGNITELFSKDPLFVFSGSDYWQEASIWLLLHAVAWQSSQCRAKYSRILHEIKAYKYPQVFSKNIILSLKLESSIYWTETAISFDRTGSSFRGSV